MSPCNEVLFIIACTDVQNMIVCASAVSCSRLLEFGSPYLGLQQVHGLYWFQAAWCFLLLVLAGSITLLTTSFAIHFVVNAADVSTCIPEYLT